MFSIRVEDRDLRRNLKQLADRDIDIAASWALNDTAMDVRDHMHERIEQVFDRPTRFTKNAIAVIRGARPSKLEAEVGERPSVGSRHNLKVQERGGQRRQTGLEGLLDSRLAYDGVITGAVPAGGAKLDAYGNWSTGQRNQVLSAVQAQREKTSNTTASSKKRNRKRAGFFVPREGSRLSAGIWKREADGSISKVLHFTRTLPVYDKRLGFYDGAAEVYADRLPVHLRRTIAKMVAKRSGSA